MPTSTIPTIERQVDFRAPPERLWRAITDEGEIATWFAQRARVELRVGALGYLEWDQHGRAPLRVEAIDPPRRFAWRWGDVGDDRLQGPSTLVEWELEPLPDGGTRLHFRESGFTQDRSRSDNVEGWHDVLGELVEHVAEEPWQGGIRRTYRFRSPPERVWQAFADEGEFAAWWGTTRDLRMTPGSEGWFEWATQGRHAVRIEAVEPVRYLAWSWTIERDVPLHEAREVLLTEWLFWPATDGGTELRLLETGFVGPDNHRENALGWDTEVEPVLRAHLGETPVTGASTTLPAIERSIELDASPERVWRALTDDAELATWFCQAAAFPAIPGTDGWLEWTEHGRFAVRCEVADPPRRLAYRWARDPDTAIDDGPATLVELTLEVLGARTVLRVHESGFVRDADREVNVQGWAGTERALREHLAQGLGFEPELR